jgi:c(7)-type cytochrome triheme protein
VAIGQGDPTVVLCSHTQQRQMSLPYIDTGKEVTENMRTYFVVAVIVIVALALSLPAFAVPSGKIVVLEPKGAGKVVFDGKMHADKGFKCADCHPGVFKMKKDGDAITMKDIREGKFCGTCHNGTKAFNAKDAVSCTKCHKN